MAGTSYRVDRDRCTAISWKARQRSICSVRACSPAGTRCFGPHTKCLTRSGGGARSLLSRLQLKLYCALVEFQAREGGGAMCRYVETGVKGMRISHGHDQKHHERPRAPPPHTHHAHTTAHPPRHTPRHTRRTHSCRHSQSDHRRDSRRPAPARSSAFLD